MKRHSRAHSRMARAKAIILAKRQAVDLNYSLPRPWGYYSKRKLMNCGHSKCSLCKLHKCFGHTKTVQEMRQDLRMFDYLGA